MEIGFECVYVLLASAISLIYISWPEKTEESKEVSFSVKNIINIIHSRTRIIYSILMLLSGIGMTIVLNVIYKDNSWITNMKSLTLILLLFSSAWMDFRKMVIPNKIIITGFLFRVIFWVFELIYDKDKFLSILKTDLFALVLVFAFFLIGMLIVKNGIGMGDIKLMMIMGLYQGFSSIVSSLFFSLFIAFFISVFLLVRRKKTKRDMIPFAPSILAGTCISIFLSGI